MSEEVQETMMAVGHGLFATKFLVEFPWLPDKACGSMLSRRYWWR